MKVLYLANYQGAEVVSQRSLRRNRALGASAKIAMISRSLRDRGHTVTILSAGTPAERSGRFYEGFSLVEGDEDSSGAAVQYLPAVDIPIVNHLVAATATRRWLRTHRVWDVALVYNLAPAEVRSAEALRTRGTPVVFEYEDDATATLTAGTGGNPGGWAWVRRARRIASGVFAANPELRAQFGHENSGVVEGVVPEEMFGFAEREWDRGTPLRILYAGGLTQPKGIDLLIEATNNWAVPHVLTITGSGPLGEFVRSSATSRPSIRFLGEVSRERLQLELRESHVFVNPHRSAGGQIGTLFPFKIVEYLSAGGVVLSSPLGQMPDVLRDAIVTYPRDDVRSLLDGLECVVCRFSELVTGARPARAYLKAMLSTRSVGARIESILQKAMRTA